MRASIEVLAKAKKFAAEILECSEADLDYGDARFAVRVGWSLNVSCC